MRFEREFRKLASSFGAAFNGIRLAVRGERNFRIHICAIFYVVIFAVLGNVAAERVVALILCFGLVTAAELINSAIELLCDIVSDRFDIALRAIKDMAAGAVLMCALASAAAGLIIFLDAEVLMSIYSKICGMPYILAIIAASVPLAVFFVARRSR